MNPGLMSPSSFSSSKPSSGGGHHHHHRSEDEVKRMFLERLLSTRAGLPNGRSLDGEDDEDGYPDRGILSQKDRDLVLAAELGKALLEKNAEMITQNEKMTEEFSLRLEHLEQEKYRLKRQIDMMEDEYEQRMLELQSDLVNYKRSLEEAEGQYKSEERDKTELINQLKEQNQRLNMELQLSSQRQEDLEAQLNALKSQFHDKRLTMRDNVVYLESLKSEIELVTRRKDDLEKQIAHLFRERESLSQALEDSTSKVLLMERQTREQMNLIRSSQRDINELTANNQNLVERLESYNRSYMSSGGSSANMSIMNEIMELSVGDSEIGNKITAKQALTEEGDSVTTFSSNVSQDEDADGHDHRQLREELISAYKQIKSLCGQIRESSQCICSNNGNHHNSHRGHDGGSSLEDLTLRESFNADYRSGFLETAVAELNDLVVRDLLLLPPSSNGSKSGNGSLTGGEQHSMEIEIHRMGELEEKKHRDLESLDLELKIKEQEINSLQNQLTIAELKLLSSEEETTVLRNDVNSVHLSKDQLIKHAWEVRDDAVKRKNEAEFSLAKERINLMQINSQLMEAIQQKIEISQRLEEWQSDMECLLDEQLRDKLKKDLSQSESIQKNAETRAASTSSRLLKFFNR